MSNLKDLPTSELDVELEVVILNLRYTLRGFAAISELKAWLDEHANAVLDERAHPDAPPSPAPIYRETQMLRGNGPMTTQDQAPGAP